MTLANPQTDPVNCYAGRGRLTLTGGNKLWGPWFDRYQVWEASMAPNEERKITVDLARAPNEEVDRAAATAGVKPAPASEMALYSPLDYQVFQRKTRTQGAVALRGRVRADFDSVQWRLTGKPLEGAAPEQWQSLRTPPGARTFEAAPPAPAGGWYRLEVRALKDGKEVAHAAVEHVGVGEVFVGAGQSNSTNCGQEKIQQHSGLASSFSGTFWQPADDPQPGAHDDSTGGSFWPAFGDAMAEKYHVPIGVASTGHSGTSVNQWQPGGGGVVRLDDGADERAGPRRLPGRALAPGRIGHRHVVGRVCEEDGERHRPVARGGRLGCALVRGAGVVPQCQRSNDRFRPRRRRRSCGKPAWPWKGRTPTR